MTVVKQILKDATKELDGQEHVKYTLGVAREGHHEKYLVTNTGVEQFKEYHYEIGSITKLFTGLLLSKSVVEGKLNLEDKIDMYFNLCENPNYPTIKELITHTAGLELEETEEYLPRENPFKYMTYDDVVSELNKYNRTQDNYSFSYSNLGAAIVGLILEKINEKPYHIQIEELIKHIGLSDTYCLNPKRDLEGVNQEGDLFGNWDWLETSAYKSAGCMVSTVTDLLKFGTYLFESEENFVTHMKETYYTENYQGDQLELGSFILKYPVYNMLYHDGGTGCFHSALCINTEGVILVALSNKYLDVTGRSFRYTHMLSKRE